MQQQATGECLDEEQARVTRLEKNHLALQEKVALLEEDLWRLKVNIKRVEMMRTEDEIPHSERAIEMLASPCTLPPILPSSRPSELVLRPEKQPRDVASDIEMAQIGAWWLRSPASPMWCPAAVLGHVTPHTPDTY